MLSYILEMDLLCQQNSCTSQQNVISPGCLWKVRGCFLIPLNTNFSCMLKLDVVSALDLTQKTLQHIKVESFMTACVTLYITV